MEKALAAVIVALIVGAIGIIYKFIKRATLGGEFKDLEKILVHFNNPADIEFDINQGQEKIKKSFTPKELCEFISLKYKERNQWKNKESELYEKVQGLNKAHDEESFELRKLNHEGLSMLYPVDFKYELAQGEPVKGHTPFPIVYCKNDKTEVTINTELAISICSLEEAAQKKLNEIGKYGTKVINSRAQNGSLRGKPTCTIGYGYKYADYHRFGFITIYKIDDLHIVIFTVSCRDDWSILCNKAYNEMLESMEYQYQLS